MNHNQAEPTLFERIFEKIAGPIVVALVLGAGTWMVKMDRTMQFLIFQQTAQTDKQDEIAKNVEKITNTIPDISGRVSFIEKTRFTESRGADLERKVQQLESEVAELKKQARK